MHSDAPRLSVAICTRNRADKLRRAVDSVLANTFADFELIVVDQSTDGKTAAAVSAIDDRRLRYIATNTVGLSKSRNVAARESRADILVYTDDDCVCDRDWLASIYTEFQADPRVFAVYGRVVPYGHHEGMICPCINESTERRVLEASAIPGEVLGGGNNMAFRKAVFRKVGLFHESLGAGTRLGHAEDTEFSFRVLFHGCRVVYTPVPLVQHDKWLDQEGFAELMKGAVRGSALVFCAYSLRFDRVAFRQLVRTAYHLLRNRLAIGSVTTGVRYFVEGLALGPLYRLWPAAAFQEPRRVPTVGRTSGQLS